MSSLEGRTAIVTGGSRGIGLACARTLLDRGARVVLTSRSQEAADDAAGQLNSSQGSGFAAHVLDEEAGRACIAFAAERFGPVDILVNNVGTNPAYGPIVEQDGSRFMKTLEVNVWGPTLWSKLVWEASMKASGGAIVNVSSIGGIAVGPGTGVYDVSKAALNHLTRQLSLELAPRVRVNTVAPGVVRTRLSEALWRNQENSLVEATPLGRIGEPEDVARAVAFLASDDASWITGETLVVDGGQILTSAAGTRELYPSDEPATGKHD